MYDLLHQRFGRLTVNGSYHKTNSTGTSELFWVCSCTCGGSTAVRSFSLRSGETSSCGCLRLESVRRARKQILTGMKFGKLTVGVRVARTYLGGRSANCYECVCDCGEKCVVQRSHLRAGTTKSCGCLRKEMKPEPKLQSGAFYVLREYKRSAKSRNLEWAISDENAKTLIETVCYYCGILPQRAVIPYTGAVVENYAYNGIDRKNNTLGYVEGNVVPCCTRCNYAKRNYSHDEFIDMCRRVATLHPEEPCYNAVPR